MPLLSCSPVRRPADRLPGTAVPTLGLVYVGGRYGTVLGTDA